MSSAKTAVLDRQQLNALISERNVKHAWLAQSIHVSDKTLTRWLNGDVTRIRHSNLKKLAHTLGCDVSLLIAKSEVEQFPSEKNRDILVNELYNDSLLYELIMNSKVRLAISLIKSTFHSMLPSAITASFYTKLGYAALIHRKQKTAKKYFQKAYTKAINSEQAEVVFSVNLAHAILYFIDCEYDKCLSYLMRCQDTISHAGQELAHFYNTFALYHLYKANFNDALSFSEKCIEACAPDTPSIEKQLFLCTALQLKGAAYLCLGDYEQGLTYCESSLAVAKKSGYPRCIRLSQAYLSAALACLSKSEQSVEMVLNCLTGADEDDVSLPTLLCAAVFVCYRGGQYDQMHTYYLKLAAICPAGSASLTFAKALMLKTSLLTPTERGSYEQDVDDALSAMKLTSWRVFIR